ncbi:MAG: ABC transporter ATP-binding protein [Candidatus Micrarchaeia archaeon]
MEIEIKNLEKKFGRMPALKDITASFGKGLTIIAGPNGAGKSTLLKCISGLYKPSSGSIRVSNEDPYASSELKKRLSILTDNYALYDDLTSEENLEFFGRMYGLPRADIKARSEEILEKINALEYLHEKVGSLSRGTKQKIALARSLLNDPSILLLDEPTAFLDPRASEEIRNIISELAEKGKTVIYVTQKIDEIAHFNARMVLIKKGRIVGDIKTYEFYKGIKNAVVEIFLVKPIPVAEAKKIPFYYSSNGANPISFKIKINNYENINEVVKYAIEHNMQIINIDGIGSLVRRFE